MSHLRGIFIVIEGLDKAGKSTQCARLVANIRDKLNKPVVQMRFPDRTTPTGKMINDYLKGDTEVDDHTIHLLFSANRWEAAPRIRELLLNGTSVVVDRYYWSGIVYSLAKERDDLTFKWARGCDIGLPMPDRCFFLDLDPTLARQRGGGYGEERYEKEAVQLKVREKFEFVFKKEDHYHVTPLNANMPVEQMEKMLLKWAESYFQQATLSGWKIDSVAPLFQEPRQEEE
ncbi:thymidylate kinase [Microthyrium microscopicum]|uniref:Thymidylate kinase n=1 Tax=Microthyrium microscopicum TaxID=703497 RepID=A0A6A6U2V5_9PEZI|nr:thymidylate kinase [Microthyrium microscopicum]